MDSFENGLIKKWKDNNLSDSSINLYLKNLRKLSGDKELKNLKFLKNFDEVMNKIKDLKETTKRNYIISVCSVFKILNDPKNKKLYTKYYDQMKEKNKIIDVRYKDGEKSETQKQNWISWKEVEEKKNELDEKVKLFSNKKKINDAEYITLLQDVLLSLYVDIAPRRNQDYLLMHIAKTKTPEDKENNYLNLKTKQFIFNNHKTSKKEGTLTIDIPDNLFNIIKIYLKFRKSETTNFLTFADGEPLKNINSITLILNKIFGKNIGSSMLRSIFLTDKYGKVNEQMEEDSKNMSHSLDMQKGYIKS